MGSGPRLHFLLPRPPPARIKFESLIVMSSVPQQFRDRALTANLLLRYYRRFGPWLRAEFAVLLGSSGLILLLAGLYFLTAKLGLALSLVGHSVTLIWPPSGLSLAALLIFGYRLWPGVALGAFVVNALTNVSLLAALGMAGGNTLEALLGAYLLNRLAGKPFSIDRVRGVMALIIAAAAGSTLVGALVGVSSLCWDGVVPWNKFVAVLRVWWMGDAMGDLVFAPAILVWAPRDNSAWTTWRWAEALLLLCTQLAIGQLVFGGSIEPLFGIRPSAFTTFPVVVWAALRFGPRGAAMSTLLATLIALWGTLHGTGPFADRSTFQEHTLLWLYANVAAVTTLVLAASLRERIGAEARLQENEARYRSLVRQSSDGIFTFDPETQRIAEANPRLLSLLGYNELDVGILTLAHVMVECADDINADIQQQLRCEQYYRGEYSYRRRDGLRVPVEVTASNVYLGNKRLTMMNVRDITDRKRAEADTFLAAMVFENTGEAIVITDARRCVLSVNRAFIDLTGYAPAEVIGTNCHILGPTHLDASFYQNMWEAIEATGHWQGEIWDRHKSGATYPCRLVVNSVRDTHGEISNYIAIYSDITERKQVDAQIRHLAQHDALTGLPNRLLLQDRVDQALLQSARYSLQVALLFIDLDRFKVINDTLGHAVGDELLDAVGQRLRGCVRAMDTVARQGGDEFVIVVPEIVRTEDAAHIARAVLAAMATPFLVRDYELYVTPSVGISVYPADGDNVQTLMKNADTAMYHAKNSGGNAYHFYAARMNESAFERLVMENDLRRALERDEFVLHYQPQVDIASGRLVGVEALLRWQHPQQGLVAPRLFIPLAEETGLIVPIGEWVLRAALRQAKGWREAGAPPFRMAVNISSRQFWRGNLRDTVEQVLRDVDVPASLLELELTESVLVRHEAETVALLKHFSEMGVLISIDDFGTGYSSLSYLKRFPIHKLKIDQSFVRDIHEDVDDAAITTAIIAMARGLHLRVIAEGVETRAQLEFLHALGCHEAQGYYLGHAVPAAALAPIVISGRLWDSDDVVL